MRPKRWRLCLQTIGWLVAAAGFVLALTMHKLADWMEEHEVGSRFSRSATPVALAAKMSFPLHVVHFRLAPCLACGPNRGYAPDLQQI